MVKTRHAIERAIEALHTIEGVRSEINFVFTGKASSGLVWGAIRAMGGAPKAALYRYEDKPDNVIESLRLQVDLVEVHAQRDRAPTSVEKAMGSGNQHNSSFMAITL